jgi:hypothetical protein
LNFASGHTSDSFSNAWLISVIDFGDKFCRLSPKLPTWMADASEEDHEMAELYTRIGQLAVERDFLAHRPMR